MVTAHIIIQYDRCTVYWHQDNTKIISLMELWGWWEGRRLCDCKALWCWIKTIAVPSLSFYLVISLVRPHISKSKGDCFDTVFWSLDDVEGSPRWGPPLTSFPFSSSFHPASGPDFTSSFLPEIFSLITCLPSGPSSHPIVELKYYFLLNPISVE